jgi:hypothetical protein
MPILEHTPNTTGVNADAAGGWHLRAPWRTSRGWTVLAIALVICTFFCLRLKPRYLLVFDSVNFALALQHFDVSRHQPHPPGYPAYVLLTNLLHRVLPDPPAVFFTAGVLAMVSSAYLLARLGEALATAKAGIAAAVLLIFNTANTSSIVTSSVRNYLAVTSALIAWLACLTWTTERPRVFFFLTAGCLGLFSGFRPELIVTLLPLLLFVAVQRKIAIRDYLLGALIYSAAILLWLVPTAWPLGGILPYFKFVREFFAGQTQIAVQHSGRFSPSLWLRMVWKGSIWTFLSVLTWIWIVPFTWTNLHSLRQRSVLAFLAFWLIPGYVFSSVVHINQSGHALATVTAVCMLGGLVIASIRRTSLFLAVLIIAAYANIYIFEHPIVRYDEAAVASIKWNNSHLGQMMEELVGISRFKPLFLVTDNSNLTWRTIHYYFPETPLLDIDGGGSMFFPFRDQVVHLHPNDIAKLPACGIIAWVVNKPESDLLQQASSTIVPGWHGLITLTNGSPGLHLKVSGMPLESDSAPCP